ncbi:hypothetical protein XELAEV_18002490mg, partial [Xenopus laevis]
NFDPDPMKESVILMLVVASSEPTDLIGHQSVSYDIQDIPLPQSPCCTPQFYSPSFTLSPTPPSLSPPSFSPPSLTSPSSLSLNLPIIAHPSLPSVTHPIPPSLTPSVAYHFPTLSCSLLHPFTLPSITHPFPPSRLSPLPSVAFQPSVHPTPLSLTLPSITHPLRPLRRSPLRRSPLPPFTPSLHRFPFHHSWACTHNGVA